MNVFLSVAFILFLFLYIYSLIGMQVINDIFIISIKIFAKIEIQETDF